MYSSPYTDSLMCMFFSFAAIIAEPSLSEDSVYKKLSRPTLVVRLEESICISLPPELMHDELITNFLTNNALVILLK